MKKHGLAHSKKHNKKFNLGLDFLNTIVYNIAKKTKNNIFSKEERTMTNMDNILYDETEELMEKVAALGEDYKHRGTLLNRVNEDATRVKLMLATYNEYLERGNKADCEVVMKNILKAVNSLVTLSNING